MIDPVKKLWIYFVAVLVLLACAGVIRMLSQKGHRRPPRPAGMVLRIEAPEVDTGIDRFLVVPVAEDRAAFGLFTPETNDFPAAFRVYGYPDGRCLSEVVGSRARLAASEAHSESAAPLLDFDRSGSDDRIEIGSGSDFGLVRITSEQDGRVLFEDRDLLEYGNDERAFPLGDLDSDGWTELALVHPRRDRSRYDSYFWDTLFGARSWVTIVSGARLPQ